MDIQLGRLALAYRTAMNAHLREQGAFTEWGLRPPSIGTLKLVARYAPISQREVSEKLGVHPSDMVGVIDQLESYGLVRRERAESDRRRYDLTLTAKGQQTLQEFDAMAQEVDRDFYGVLSPAEQKQLVRLVAKLIDHHVA